MIAIPIHLFLNDLNTFAAENNLPLNFQSLPSHDCVLVNRAVKPFITDKKYLGKIQIAVSWSDFGDVPFVSITCHAHGMGTINYKGFERSKSAGFFTPYKDNNYVKPSAPATVEKESEGDWLRKVQLWWNKAKPASASHPYLLKKGIDKYAHFFKQYKDGRGDWLMVQLSNGSFQLIGSDGKKLFAGETKGAYFLIGQPDGKIFICEGMATGLSVHNGNRCVAVALNASNLYPVSQELRKSFGDGHELVFCADNDDIYDEYATLKNPNRSRNVGIESAHNAACEWRKSSFNFPPYIDGKTDWNDWSQKLGEITDSVLEKNTYQKRYPRGLVDAKSFDDVFFQFSFFGFILSDNEIVNRFKSPFMSYQLSAQAINNIAEINQHLADEILKDLNAMRLRTRDSLESFLAKLNNVPKVIDAPYLPTIDWKIGTQEEQQCYFIKSPLGSGKTTQLKSLIERAKREGLRVFYASPRMILSKNMAKELGLTDYKSVKIPRESDYLSLVINSIGLLQGDKRHIVIVDESEQVFSQITADIIKNKKDVIGAFDSLIQNAQTVVCMDAHLSADITESFVMASINRCEKAAKYTFIKNENKRFTGRKMFTYSTREELLDKCVELSQTTNLFVATNSFNESEKIKNALLIKNPSLKIKVVNSDNSNEPDTIAFVENIETEAQKYNVLIASPSLTSGVSINDTAKHFGAVIGFFYSNIHTSTPLEAMQQIARVRYAQTCHIWYQYMCNELTSDKVELLHEKETLNTVGKEMGIIFDDGVAQFTPYFQLYLNVKLTRNKLMRFAHFSFLHLAEKDGWVILDGTGNKEAGADLLKAAKDIFLREETYGVVNANPLSDKECATLKESAAMNKDDRFAVERHEIETFYNEQINEELLEKDCDGKTRIRILNRELMNTDHDTLIERDKATYLALKERGATPHFKLKKVLSNFYRWVVYAYAGDGTESSKNVQSTIAWVKKNSVVLRACGINPNVNKPMQFLGIHALNCGYKAKARQITVNGERVRAYALVSAPFIDEVIERRVQLGLSRAVPVDVAVSIPDETDHMFDPDDFNFL